MTCSDEQLALETLVSFAAARAGVTYCRTHRSQAIFDDVISGTRGVVLIGIDQPWVACVEGAWI